MEAPITQLRKPPMANPASGVAAPSAEHSATQQSERDSDKRPRIPWWIAVVAIACIPFAATLYASSRGAGVTPDSVSYLSAGRNLADGNGLHTFSGAALTVFPPGLPAVIAAADAIGLPTRGAMRVINALAIAASVVLAGIMLHRHTRSRAVALSATAFLAVSVALLTVGDMVWSEPLFIVVTLLWVLALERTVTHPNRWNVASCILLTWMAFLLRYAGMALIPIGLVAVLVGLWSRDRKHAVGVAAAFTGLSLIVPIGWFARNHSIDGTIMGPRYPSTDSASDIAKNTLTVLESWVRPSMEPLRWPVTVSIIVAIAAAFVAGWLTRRNRATPASGSSSLAPLVTFTVGYLAYLLIAQFGTAFDPIDNRLMSPLVIPVVVLMAIGIDRALAGSALPARIVVAALAVILVAVQVIGFANEASRAARTGNGFNARAWDASELDAAVSALPRSAVVYSNNPVALWAQTEREPLAESPARFAYRSTTPIEIAPKFLEDAACRTTYLAWFTPEFVPPQAQVRLRPLEQLQQVVVTDRVATVPGGTLYRVKSLGPPIRCP